MIFLDAWLFGKEGDKQGVEMEVEGTSESSEIKKKIVL